MDGRVNSVNELYRDKTLYTSPDMFSPPSERLPHVIRFELTEGCTWNACTYCNGYEGIKPRIKSFEEYQKHVDAIWERIEYRSELAESLGRIFIGGGNALATPTSELEKSLQYTYEQFTSHTSYHPRRIAIYGRTNDIYEKKEGLQRLQRKDYDEWGIDLIYWGVESGSDNVLDYINKGYSKNDIIEAAKTLNRTLINTSVMIMPGLGGIKFYQEHIDETAEVLNYIRPNFLTFMGINPAPNSAYTKIMHDQQKKGENRPLTDLEKAKQMIEIIQKISLRREMKVGCFNYEIDSVGHNPLTFSKKLEERGDEIYLANNLRKLLARITERRNE